MYVPACDERKVVKTTTIRADSLVFDLEDGVALNQKVGGGRGAAEILMEFVKHRVLGRNNVTCTSKLISGGGS